MPRGDNRPLSMKQLALIRNVADGMSTADAAAAAGLTYSVANKTLKRPDAQKLFVDYANNVMREAASKAAKRLVAQLDSDNEWVVQQAAGRILQYLQTIENSQNATITVNFSNSMPRPGMPEKPAIEEENEDVIRADGEVN